MSRKQRVGTLNVLVKTGLITAAGSVVAGLLQPTAGCAQQLTTEHDRPNVAVGNGKPVSSGPQNRFSGFVRGVYFPWERVGWVAKNAGLDTWTYCDRLLGELKNRYHVDLIWVIHTNDETSRRLGDMALKYDITAIFESGHAVGRNELRTPESVRGIARDTINSLGAMPGVAGYVLKDEPLLSDIESMENIRREISLLDPLRPSFVVTMPRETETLARNTKLPFIVPDCYPFFGDGSPNGPGTPEQSRDYYKLVSKRTADLANVTGKTPWIMPMVFSDLWGRWYYDKAMNAVAEPGTYIHWRMPTVGETRWQIWQAIVAGVKGTVFYVLFPTENPRHSAQDAEDIDGFRYQKPAPDWPHTGKTTPLGWGTGLLHSDGSPTPQMNAMAAAYAQIEPHRDLLGRLQPTLPLAFASAPLHSNTFRDPQTNRTYIALVNENTNDTVNGRLTLLPRVGTVRNLITDEEIATKPVEAGTARAGTARNETTGQVSLPITLGPGEGTLLQLESDVGATRTYREDFSIAQSIGQFENIHKVAVPREWGLGYQLVAKAGTDKQDNSSYGQPLPAPVAAVQPVNGENSDDLQSDKAKAAMAKAAMVKVATAQRGRLTYKIKDVAGVRDGVTGHLYLICQGTNGGAQPGVEIAVSSDEKTYRPLATDRFDEPVEIPADTRVLRFSLLHEDATMSGWQMIAVP